MIQTGSVAVVKIHTLPQPTWTHLVVEPGCSVVFKKDRVTCDILLKSKFGDDFRIFRGELIAAEPDFDAVPPDDESGSEDSAGSEDDAALVPNANDNRNLVDTNTAQRLTAEEIEAIRLSSNDPSAIAAGIAAGSSTFLSKTRFSRAKYLRKKLAKHAPRVSVFEPSPLHLLLTQPSADRVLNLRFDSLALLLSYANVHRGARVLVVDDTPAGAVVATVMYKLYGTDTPATGTIQAAGGHMVRCILSDGTGPAAALVRGLLEPRAATTAATGAPTGARGAQKRARSAAADAATDADAVVSDAAVSPDDSAGAARPRPMHLPPDLPHLPAKSLWMLGLAAAAHAAASVEIVPITPRALPFIKYTGGPTLPADATGAEGDADAAAADTAQAPAAPPVSAVEDDSLVGMSAWLAQRATYRASYGVLRAAADLLACPLRGIPGAVPAGVPPPADATLPTCSAQRGAHGGGAVRVTGDVLVAALAPTADVYATLAVLLPRLCVRRGGAFAVYCPALTPLTTAYAAIKQHGIPRQPGVPAQHVVDLNVFDSVARTFVVAPERTHPAVTATGTGAILTGTVVLAADDTTPRPSIKTGALSSIANLIGPTAAITPKGFTPCTTYGCPCGSIVVE